MDESPVLGLVCAGGGAHGAYQVGVIKYLHEHFCNGDASPFRVFSGTSAGSLNTAFLATRSFDARLAVGQLEELWRGFHVKEYHGNIFRNAASELMGMLPRKRRQRKQIWSLLTPQPLREITEKGFVRADFDRAIAEGTTLGLAVSATEMRTARCVWFQEGPAAAAWRTVNASGLVRPIAPAHIQASCSVPFAFPPVEIDGLHYLDGGVANIGPFTPAINMGATRILSVATDQPLPPTLPDPDPEFKPRVQHVAETLLYQLNKDFSGQQAQLIDFFNGLLQRSGMSMEEERALIRHVLFGTELRPTAYSAVKTLLFAPSRRIRHASLFNPDLFDESLKGKSTVMLFHRDFLMSLIDFGYADAKDRHDELEGFLRSGDE